MCVDLRSGACHGAVGKLLGRRGLFEYRHVYTGAMDMPSATPIWSRRRRRYGAVGDADMEPSATPIWSGHRADKHRGAREHQRDERREDLVEPVHRTYPRRRPSPAIAGLAYSFQLYTRVRTYVPRTCTHVCAHFQEVATRSVVVQ